MVKIKEVCEINPKKTEVKDLEKSNMVSFIPMVDIGEHEIYSYPKQSKKLDEVYSGYTYFRDGDVVLAKVTPCFENRKAGIVKNLTSSIGFGSSEYIVLRPKSNILPEMIYSYITSNNFNVAGRKVMTGIGGLKRIPTKFVEEYLIPLPDLKTQESLVTEIIEKGNFIKANKKIIEAMEVKISELISVL